MAPVEDGLEVIVDEEALEEQGLLLPSVRVLHVTGELRADESYRGHKVRRKH